MALKQKHWKPSGAGQKGAVQKLFSNLGQTVCLSAGLAACLSIFLAACGGSNDKRLSKINNDWTGNEIQIESLADEKVDGITCHMVHFDRSVIDRLRKGSWFENPSNGTIHCAITGPITIGDIDLGKNGEKVFSQNQSLIFKKLTVRRVYDAANNTLVYLVYSRQIIDGSAKMAIASVALYNQDVTWLTRQSETNGTSMPIDKEETPTQGGAEPQ